MSFLIQFWFSHDGTATDLKAAIRSSMRSRSTSQNLRRRKQQAVPWFNLGGFVIIRYRGRRCLGTFARFLRCPFGLRRSQTCPPQSSRSHQRFPLLVIPFLVTFGSRSRCNTGCDRLVAVTRAPSFERNQTRRDALRVFDGCGRSSRRGGRSSARYCASNARKAAVTVAPIPTIPSSTLGPSSAIHSSPRTNNLGRRTADGLPG